MIRACSITASVLSALYLCVGLPAGAVITASGGRSAGKEGHVPTTKRPPRALYITRATLERTPAGDILDAFELIGAEVVRRIRNYAEAAGTPASLLDGIQFAAAAREIQMGFTHRGYPYGLFHARDTLLKMMGEPWEESEFEMGGDDV
jgi:hypothetical protein